MDIFTNVATATYVPMTKKQQYQALQKAMAMTNYLEAMDAKDPVMFVLEKYNCESERVAKNKIYSWQHNYGTNLKMIANKVKEIEAQLAACQPQMKKESIEQRKAEIESKTQENSKETKLSKKQEELITRNHLEQMRKDLEAKCVKLDDDIDMYKKKIDEAEASIESISKEINAIRAMLDIFKEKDARFAQGRI